MFFTFEGIDGSGKTTQAILFTKYLQEHGLPVFLTREPGQVVHEDRDVIADLRRLCFRKENNPVTTFLAFSLDRAIHHNEVIDPKLENGEVVVSDRGLASTYAYQVHGKGVGRMTFQCLVSEVVNLMPALTFWIDLGLDEARRRVADRNDHPWSQDQEDFYRRVYNGYSEIYEKQSLGSRSLPTLRIPAEGSANDVHQRILDELHKNEILVEELKMLGYNP